MTGLTPRRIWVVGPIAWDTVLHLEKFPQPGRYARGLKKIERPGGSAGNVAQAVATTGLEVGFVSALGSDAKGKALHKTLEASSLQHLHIKRVRGETNHVLVMVDGEGDRTIIGLAGNGHDTIHLDDTPIRRGDIVVFVVWDTHFLADLNAAQAAGCITVVGLGALKDPRVTRADIAFGSHADVPEGTDPRQHLDRFDRIVMTNGEQGAKQFTAHGVIHQPAFPAQIVDTTGAGDAFISGYLAVYAHGLTEGSAALEAGARWAAVMVEKEASIPPPWIEIPRAPGLLEDIPEPSDAY